MPRRHSPQPEAVHLSRSEPARTRGRWARFRRLTLLLIALLVVSVVVVSQSGLIKAVVLPQIEKSLGCEAQAGKVRLTPGGRVVIHDLTLRPPAGGLDSEFLTVGTIVIDVDWGGAISGGSAVDALRLVRPRVSLVMDQDGRLDLASLTPRGAGPGGGSDALPALEIIDGVIELAERRPAGLRTLASLNVMGGITPVPGRPGVASIEFSQPPAPSTRASVSAASGLRVAGEIDLRASRLDVTLEGVDLAEWQRQTPPSFLEPFWGTLEMSGTIPRTRLSSTPLEGVQVALELDGVTLSLPTPMRDDAVGMQKPSAGGLPPGNAPLPMRDVTGSVTLGASGIDAALRGQVGELPVRARLLAESLTGGGELSCRVDIDPSRISRETPLWDFVPEDIDTLVDRLGGPTPTLAGHVQLNRRRNAEGRLVTEASGAFDLRDGTAKFDAFPYPAQDIRATITFQGSRIHIYNLTGFGPSGAPLAGAVSVWSRRGVDWVDLKITGAGVPVDDHLIQALNVVRPGLWDELVSPLDYAAIAAEPARAARLREGGFLPAGIEPGATIDLSISATRDEGGPHKWAYLIDIRSPAAGLIPKVFPYPVIAEDLRVRVTRGEAVIRPTRLRSPSGASGSISGVIELLKGDDQVAPHLVVDMEALGSFEDLVRAIAPPAREGLDPSRTLAAQVVRDLNLAGPASALVSVTPQRFDPPSGTRVQVRVRPDGLEAYPGPAGLALRADTGLIIADHERIEVPTLDGQLAGSPFRVRGLSLPLGPAGDSRGVIAIDALDAEAPIEHLLAALARPEEAAAITEMRSRRSPSGRLDVAVDLSARPVTLTFDNLRELAIEAEGVRPSITTEAGHAVYREGVLTLKGLSGTIGAARDSERWALNDLSGVTSPAGVDLALRWTGARLNSPLVRSAIAQASPSADAWLTDMGVRMAFDADLRLQSDADAPIRASGTISPRSIGVEVDGVGFELANAEGEIALDGPSITFRNVSGIADHLTLSIDGVADGATSSYDLSLTARGSKMPPIIPALLPPQARAAIDALQVRPGDFTVEGARIVRRGEGSAGDAPWREVHATIAFSGLSLDPITPITDVRGTLDLHLAQPRPDAPITLAGRAVAERLRVLGLTFTHATADIRSDDGASVELAGLRLEGYGGTATGRIGVEARPNPPGPAGAAFDAELRLSRIDFGRALAELEVAEQPPTSGDASAPQPDVNGIEPAFRGWLDASVSLAGLLADPASRRGRGELRIEGGDVLQMPGAVNAMRAANLQGASDEPLDYASAQFHISGQRIVIEQASIENPSGSFRVLGAGYIELPSTAIEMVFTPQSTGVAIVSEVFAGLRDEIATPYLTGTLARPRLEVRQFGRVRGMLATIFQGGPRQSRVDQPDQPPAIQEQP